MQKHHSSIFGALNLEAAKNGYSADYEVEMLVNNRPVTVDVNFKSHKITPEKMAQVERFAGNLNDFDEQNQRALFANFNCQKRGEDYSVKEYLEFHLEECAPEELAKLIDFKDKNTAPIKQLLAKLLLVRVGLYPEAEEDSFAVFDYSIGREIADGLIVIYTFENGKISLMTSES